VAHHRPLPAGALVKRLNEPLGDPSGFVGWQSWEGASSERAKAKRRKSRMVATGAARRGEAVAMLSFQPTIARS